MSELVHNDVDPFCDCPSCAAELESMIAGRQARNTARNWRLERIEAEIAQLKREVAALKERIGE